jgi:succinoglycan biosynthesis protein ExoO
MTMTPASTETAPPPTVTVVIPVYNSATTLERCVRSAMGQTLTELEILVADDGSTDTSAELAAALAAEDRRIRLIRISPNQGKSHAMNVMIEQAQGDWIAVLDADDTMDRMRLAELLGAAQACQADLVADNLQYFDAGVNRVLRSGFPPFTLPRIFTTQDLLGKNSTFADFDYGLLKPMVRRAFVQQYRLQYYEQTRLAEDFYYLLALLVAGGRCCLIGQPLYRWTLPFGTESRSWTTTGAGAWRYDYREALAANAHFITEMTQRARPDVVRMLSRRARQYQVMIHYLSAQRLASEHRWPATLTVILTHPSTWGLLISRITGRIVRRWASPRRRPATDAAPVMAP